MRCCFFLGEKQEKINKEIKRKGFDDAIFLKKIKKFDDVSQEDKKKFDGIFVDNKNFEIVRKICEKFRRNFLLFFVNGQDDFFNRQCCEYKKIDFIVNPERTRRKDFMHYRNSGFNHITAKLCNKNKISLFINLEELLGKEKKEQALELGRIWQNLKICKKYGVKVIVGYLTNKISKMPSFKKILEIMENLKLSNLKKPFDISEIIERNLKINSGKLIAEGIEIIE